MSHHVLPTSGFSHDLTELEDMVDYLDCIVMYPEHNPVSKKDVVTMIRRIRAKAYLIEIMTKVSGWEYFEEPRD